MGKKTPRSRETDDCERFIAKVCFLIQGRDKGLLPERHRIREVRGL